MRPATRRSCAGRPIEVRHQVSRISSFGVVKSPKFRRAASEAPRAANPSRPVLQFRWPDPSAIHGRGPFRTEQFDSFPALHVDGRQPTIRAAALAKGGPGAEPAPEDSRGLASKADSATPRRVRRRPVRPVRCHYRANTSATAARTSIVIEYEVCSGADGALGKPVRSDYAGCAARIA